MATQYTSLTEQKRGYSQLGTCSIIMESSCHFQRFKKNITFGNWCNFLNYFQVLSAIPKDLLEKARTVSPIDMRNFACSTSYQLSEAIVINENEVQRLLLAIR